MFIKNTVVMLALSFLASSGHADKPNYLTHSKIYFYNNGSAEIRIVINGDLSDFYVIKPGAMVAVRKYLKKKVEVKTTDDGSLPTDVLQEVAFWWDIKKLDIRDPKAKLGTLTGGLTLDMNVRGDLLENNTLEELNNYQGNILYAITPGVIKGYTVQLLAPKDGKNIK